jgi:hypothetical protein
MLDSATAQTVQASFKRTGTSVTTMSGTRADYTASAQVGTAGEQAPNEERSSDPRQWALDWLAGEAAVEYEGQWVALGRDLVVRASGPSPSAIRDSVSGQPGLVVLYVVPRNAVLIGGSRLVAYSR